MEKRGRYVASIKSLGMVSGEERIFTRQEEQQKMDKRHKADLHFPYCGTRLSEGFLWGG